MADLFRLSAAIVIFLMASVIICWDKPRKQFIRYFSNQAAPRKILLVVGAILILPGSAIDIYKQMIDGFSSIHTARATQPTSQREQESATVTTSLVCKSPNLVVNFRSSMNLDYPTLSSYNEPARELLNTKILPDEYRSLLRYPSLWGKPNSAMFLLYTFYMSTFANNNNPERCNLLLSGIPVGIVNANEADNLSLIEYGGERYWISSDALSRD